MKKGEGWYIEEYENPRSFEIRDTDGSIVASNYARDYEHDLDYRLMLAQARRLVRLLGLAERSTDERIVSAAVQVQMPKKMFADTIVARTITPARR